VTGDEVVYIDNGRCAGIAQNTSRHSEMSYKEYSIVQRTEIFEGPDAKNDRQTPEVGHALPR